MALLPKLQMRMLAHNGSVSRPGWFLPAETPVSDALQYANSLRSVLQPLSYSPIGGAILHYTMPIAPSGAAAIESDNKRHLALFYSTASISGTIVIPSPRQLAYDDSGPWQGFRLMRQSAIDSGIVDEIEQIVAGTVFKTGELFPNMFLVGALEEIVP